MARRRQTSSDVVLENPLRRSLFDRILRRPGLRLRELVRNPDEPRGTVHYHLDILERAGALKSRHEGGATRYYPATMDDRAARQIGLLLRGRVLEVVMEIARQPGIGQDQLVRTRRISRKVLRDYVPRLVEAGLLSVEQGPRTKYYQPTDELRRMLDELERGDVHGGQTASEPGPK